MCLCVHGTSSTAIDSISKDGFKLSVRGSFGRGIYLGENGSVGVLFAQQYSNDQSRRYYNFRRGNVEGRMTMLICYVKPGIPDTIDARKPGFKLENPFTVQIFGNDVQMTSEKLTEKSSLIATNQTGYNELIIYDNTRVYPAYVVSFWPEYNSKINDIVIASYTWFTDHGELARKEESELREYFKARPYLLSMEIYCSVTGYAFGLYGLQKNGHKIILMRMCDQEDYEKTVLGKKKELSAPLLYWAMFFRKNELVKVLLDAGADARQVSKGGITGADFQKSYYESFTPYDLWRNDPKKFKKEQNYPY